MKKLLISYCLFSLSILVSNAQFTQHGQTLMYNGRNPKTIYSSPVTISYKGAQSALNHPNGQFDLRFNNKVQGNVVPYSEISIGNKNYVLFNKSEIEYWTLTPEKKLNVVLCNISLINQKSKTYTENYVARLRKQYNNAVKLAKNNEKDADALRIKLEALKRNYENEIEQIKSQSLMFAYVDENEIDSLEYLWRQCIMNNEIDKSIEVAKEMELQKNANSISEDLDMFTDKATERARQLQHITEVISQHIYNLESVKENEDSIKPYYATIINNYRQLVRVYTTSLRCSEEQLNILKKNLGDALYNYGSKYCNDNDSLMAEYMNEAAKYDNSDALMYLVDNSSYTDSKKFLIRILDNIKNKNAKLPEYYTLESLEEEYETYPDFYEKTKGNVFFYHILNEKEVSLCYCYHCDTTVKTIIVPDIVKHLGKSYLITTIGESAFNSCPRSLSHDSIPYNDILGYEVDPLLNISMWNVNHIQLPNSITTIRSFAFGSWADQHDYGTFFVNIPSGVKYIGTSAYMFVTFDNQVIKLPEGLLRIDNPFNGFHGDWAEDKPYSFYLPSTLQEINDWDYYDDKYTPTFGKIVIANGNKWFTTIDGILHSADSTKAYLSTLSKGSDEIAFTINKRALIDFNGEGFKEFVTGVPAIDLAKSIKVDPDNERYTSIGSVIFNKNRDSVLYIPPCADSLVITNPDTKLGENVRINQLAFISLPINISLEFIEKMIKQQDWVVMSEYEHPKIKVQIGDVIKELEFDEQEEQKIDLWKKFFCEVQKKYTQQKNINDIYNWLAKEDSKNVLYGKKLME